MTTTIPNRIRPGMTALEELSSGLLERFAAFGAHRVEIPVLQSADTFLERMGEELRSQIYVFSGPNGDELCLRPDLTIPVAQAYLAQDSNCIHSKRLSYAGSIFRHDPESPSSTGEQFQAGVESINEAVTPELDAEILALTVSALKGRGINDSAVTVGDVTLFRALLAAMNLPKQWELKIRRHAWHAGRLRALLKNLGEPPQPGSQLVATIRKQPQHRVEEILRESLSAGGIKLIGTRSLEEIAERLSDRAMTSAAEPLSVERARLIEEFLAIQTGHASAVKELHALCQTAKLDIGQALNEFQKRSDLLAKSGDVIAQARFATRFGRSMEYYSGFVFEVRTGSNAKPLAAGGRYDELLGSIGAPRPTPAIGLAVFCDRVLEALRPSDQRAGKC